MTWTARITGDMTLSLLDQDGLKVLGVDMLRMNTMRAGDDGELLARTVNDFRLLARAADHADTRPLALADRSAGLSPLPWRVEYQQQSRRLEVRDARNRIVGERAFPKGVSPETLTRIVQAIRQAVDRIASTKFE